VVRTTPLRTTVSGGLRLWCGHRHGKPANRRGPGAVAAGTRIESRGTAVADNGCGVDNTVADNGVRRFKAVVRTPPWKTCHPTRHGRCGRVTCIESFLHSCCGQQLWCGQHRCGQRCQEVAGAVAVTTCHPTRFGRCGRVTCIESLGTAVAITARGGAGRRGRAHLPLRERPMFLARV
jgi:hypothetical protein